MTFALALVVAITMTLAPGSNQVSAQQQIAQTNQHAEIIETLNEIKSDIEELKCKVCNCQPIQPVTITTGSPFLRRLPAFGNVRFAVTPVPLT